MSGFPYYQTFDQRECTTMHLDRYKCQSSLNLKVKTEKNKDNSRKNLKKRDLAE